MTTAAGTYSRAAYRGSRRKLVLAFDVGTTYSGISYSILDPGQVPEVKSVTRFPSHSNTNHISASKVPSVIYYDRKGDVKAVGAATATEYVIEQALDEEWVKSEWFKLHLRPSLGDRNLITSTSSCAANASDLKALPPLPPNKSAVQVFADYLRYLFECSETYIKQTHVNGAELWKSVKDDVDFVLSHPNGWEGRQQEMMRKAASLAGLTPSDTEKIDGEEGGEQKERITFVTEGEASLHFAVQDGRLGHSLEEGQGVVIVDAGGGTIDISSYRQAKKEKRSFEELATPQCHFFGSVFVSVNARKYLEMSLRNSPFVDDLDHIVTCFDATTKPRFRPDTEPSYIKFGSTKDNDLEHKIRFGQLKLEGTEVATFFEPSLKCIVTAVKAQIKSTDCPMAHIVLVGGFSANDWLLDRISHEFEMFRLQIMRPEEHISKAVSDGAISFYLDNFVRVRMSKYVYGCRSNPVYIEDNEEHVKRFKDTYLDKDGERIVRGGFSVLIHKDVKLSEAKEYKLFMKYVAKSPDAFSQVGNRLWYYKGKLYSPKWVDEDEHNFAPLCHVSADLRPLVVGTEPQKTKDGVEYWSVTYHIVLIVGSTEMKAQVLWKQDGVEKRGPASISYEP